MTDNPIKTFTYNIDEIIALKKESLKDWFGSLLVLMGIIPLMLIFPFIMIVYANIQVLLIQISLLFFFIPYLVFLLIVVIEYRKKKNTLRNLLDEKESNKSFTLSLTKGQITLPTIVHAIWLLETKKESDLTLNRNEIILVVLWINEKSLMKDLFLIWDGKRYRQHPIRIQLTPTLLSYPLFEFVDALALLDWQVLVIRSSRSFSEEVRTENDIRRIQNSALVKPESVKEVYIHKIGERYGIDENIQSINN